MLENYDYVVDSVTPSIEKENISNIRIQGQFELSISTATIDNNMGYYTSVCLPAMGCFPPGIELQDEEDTTVLNT